MLTDQKVRKVEPPLRGNVIQYDGKDGIPGFGVRVTSNGVRSFILSYRANGRDRRMTLGRHGAWSVAAARKRAAQLRVHIESGSDPLLERRTARNSLVPMFGDLCDDYLTRHASGHKDGGAADQGMLAANLQKWQRRRVADITRADIRRLVGTKAQTAPVMANRLQQTLSRVFSFAVDEEIIELAANPLRGLKYPTKEKPRERVMLPEEIKMFWGGLECVPLPPGVVAALRFILVTAARSGEVVGMTRNEIEDGETWWQIPGERTKNGRTHRVPLSSLAQDILGKQQRGDGPIFRSLRGKALTVRKLSFALHQNLETLGLENVTPHDLRRTCATELGRLNIDSLVISALLNHRPKGLTERVYQLYRRDEEKQQALERWAQRLRQIVSGQMAEVVAIHG